MRKPRTKKDPTPSTAEKTDVRPQVDTPKRSWGRIPAVLALDTHQAEAVAVLAERLGGTTDEVLEFLVTTGLYALQFDELAEGRVREGVERLYGDSEISRAIMGELTDLECNVKNDVWDFKVRTFRPRMAGDWRGAAPAEV